MKFSFSFGKHFGRGRLSPEQQAVLERLEAGEITPQEAEKLLGGTVRIFDFSIGDAPDDKQVEPDAAEAETGETAEERKARELIERIAREVDAEKGG